MDPVSQGVLGATAAQLSPYMRSDSSVQISTKNLFAAAGIGAFAGMAPDLDILIFSNHDPLLFLEYHRQFTHALIFIPFGALLCATLAHLVVRNRLRFGQTYVLCLFGYATHALLDACTSYGTQLFWPFSNARIAWNNVSVVDPLFTVPALLLVWLSIRRNSRTFAAIAFGWMISYLLLGMVQRDRALDYGTQLAAKRGHQPVRLEVKPAFANLLLWKLVYEADNQYHIDAVRTGIELTHFDGERATKLNIASHLPWLDPTSQQAKDIERFRWFSDDFLAVDKYHPSGTNNTIGVVDVRYSMLPNEVRGMWGIGLTREATPEAHVEFYADRTLEPERRDRFIQMLFDSD